MHRILLALLLMSGAARTEWLRPSPADPHPLRGIPSGIRFPIAPA